MKEQDIRMILAGKLKEFRLRKGLTAKQVGLMIGKSDRTVSGWEHGRGQPDADMLIRLCDVFGIKNIAEFYDDTPESDNALSDDEKELIAVYRSLNQKGKGMMLAILQVFSGNPNMQKEDGNIATA